MNPYREHADRVQALVKEVSREYIDSTAYEKRYADNQEYNSNFVVVSGGNPFDSELKTRLDEMFKEVGDATDTTTL